MSGARSNFHVYTGTGATQVVALPAAADILKIVRMDDGQEALKLESMAGSQYLRRDAAGAATLPATVTLGIALTRADGVLSISLGTTCVFNAVGIKYAAYWFE